MDQNMIINSKFNQYSKKISKLAAISMFAGTVFLGGISDSYAEISTVSGSNVMYLQAGYFIKSVEASLMKYRASMIIMSHTENRDDFLVNRDELWASREELTKAIATLKEYTRSPLYAEENELMELLSNLLIKSEAYANNQNEVIALKNKIDEGLNDLPDMFANVVTAEKLVKQRTLDDNQSALYERMEFTRKDYQAALKKYFKAKTVAEIEAISQELQDSYSAFLKVMEEAKTAFPETADVYQTTQDYVNKIFAERGIGNIFYSYLQKVDEQTIIYFYFTKTVKDARKIIASLNNRLNARLSF